MRANSTTHQPKKANPVRNSSIPNIWKSKGIELPGDQRVSCAANAVRIQPGTTVRTVTGRIRMAKMCRSTREIA